MRQDLFHVAVRNVVHASVVFINILHGQPKVNRAHRQSNKTLTWSTVFRLTLKHNKRLGLD